MMEELAFIFQSCICWGQKNNVLRAHSDDSWRHQNTSRLVYLRVHNCATEYQQLFMTCTKANLSRQIVRMWQGVYVKAWRKPPQQSYLALMSTPGKSNIMPLSPRVILNKFTIYHMNEIRSQLLHNYTALMQSPLTKRIERVKFRDIFLSIFLSFIFLAVRQGLRYSKATCVRHWMALCNCHWKLVELGEFQLR